MPGRMTRWMAAYRQRLRRVYPGIRKTDPRAQYAWVLEDHLSGQPHAHVVLTLPVVEWSDEWWDWVRWGRKAWERICGRHVPRQQWEVVRNQGRMSKYLVKYLTKLDLPLRLYAMMYRRRIWACSYPATPPEPAKGWHLERFECDREIEMDPSELMEKAFGEGWIRVYGQEGGNVWQWARSLQEPSGNEGSVDLRGSPE